MDVVADSPPDQTPVQEGVFGLLGASHHEEVGLQRPEAALPSVAARQVHVWQTKTYPEIRSEAKRAEATIYFGDESGIRSDYHVGTTWAPQGQTPVVQATGQRFSLNMISAVATQGEFRFMLHEGTVGAKVFVEFLKRLMLNAERPVFLIVDGHPIHKAKVVRRYIESLDGKLKLFYLPPYSPHLNPDETVWAHVKRRISCPGRELKEYETARTRLITQHSETPRACEVIL